MSWVVLIVGGLLIGLTLGLMGSGGSILTLPVLVYLVGHAEKVAIAESMAIVGLIAMVTVIPYARAREVHWHSVLYFGIPGVIGTIGGAFLTKFIPPPVLLIIFAAIMLLASVLMLRKPKSPKASTLPKEAIENQPPESPEGASDHHPIWQVVAEGLAVGVVTGMVGVGGGFLIVPALVILGGLPMRLAVGTSLVVIAMKSFVGFSEHVVILGSEVDWTALLPTIAMFTLFGVIGSFAGRFVSQRINQIRLRKAFAVFLIVMGVVILSVETYKLLNSGQDPDPETSRPSTAIDSFKLPESELAMSCQIIPSIKVLR